MSHLGCASLDPAPQLKYQRVCFHLRHPIVLEDITSPQPLPTLRHLEVLATTCARDVFPRGSFTQQHAARIDSFLVVQTLY